MSRWLRALTLAWLLFSGVSSAQSRDSSEPAKKNAEGASSEARVKADALIQQGIALRREKRDAEALERFQHAHELSPSARALAQIGLAELALSRFDASEAHLREALGKDDDWVRRNRATLERSLNAAGAHLGSVNVSSNVRGAELWLNGERAGVLPLGPQRVLAGNVRVELRRSSGERTERALTLAAGATHHVHVDFVEVRTRTKQPITGARASARERAAADAQTSSPAAASAPRTAAWMLVATGVVFLGEAVVAHVLRERFASEYNDDGECLHGQLSRRERCGEVLGKAQTARTLAIAGYIGAGVAFGTAGVLFAVASPVGTPVHSAGVRFSYSARF
ncbi:MAG TPA: tetratricopeptide repeat protein [Polyangiaceae bacterium]